MSMSEQRLPLTDVAGLSAAQRQRLEEAGIGDVTGIFMAEGRLRDAVELAGMMGVSVREAVEVRHVARQHLVTLLSDLAEKRKVAPLALLWKIHWLLGLFPQGDLRGEALHREEAAIQIVTEALEPEAEAVERIMVVRLHRTLILPPEEIAEELKCLVEAAEQFQRTSLLAYRLAKAKPLLLATVDESPARRIAALRKTAGLWRQLTAILEQRKDAVGQRVMEARWAADNLAVLDLSEQHFRERVQQAMTLEKLKQSQLARLTAIMNAAVELKDAHLVAAMAQRGSNLWFELAQDKKGRTLVDALIRSFRFARTALFHLRVLDDVGGAVGVLKRLSHLFRELPETDSAVLTEALTGLMESFVRAAPLLDRPADEPLILEFQNRVGQAMNRLARGAERDTQLRLMQLHYRFLSSAHRQLEVVGARPEILRQGHLALIKSLLLLAELQEGEDQTKTLEEAASHASRLIGVVGGVERLASQELGVVSSLAARLSRLPISSLSQEARRLVEQGHLLDEQAYARARDPAEKAELGLQLLLARATPTPSGEFPTLPDQVDQLKEYATAALAWYSKEGDGSKALKAGAVLTGILLHQALRTPDKDQRLNLIREARRSAEQTLTMLPEKGGLEGENRSFALLLLGSLNDMVYLTMPPVDPQWEQLLKQMEQLALLINTEAEGEAEIQLLAMSAAARATTSLALLKPPGPKRTRLLTRSVSQMRRALEAAYSTGEPEKIRAAITHYDRIMRSRIATTPPSDHRTLLEEWSLTYHQAAEALERAGATDDAGHLHAHRILTTEIPLLLIRSAGGSLPLEVIKRELTKLLMEAAQIGSPEEAELARRLERQWAFQLGARSLTIAGFRIEDTPTGLALSDEHFRVSLQAEEQVAINGQSIAKGEGYPYLRPSPQPESPLWYDLTPILSTPIGDSGVNRWIILEQATEQTASIEIWLFASRPLTLTYVLGVDSTLVERFLQTPEGVTIQLSEGGQLHLQRGGASAEQRKESVTVCYELSLKPGQPEVIPLKLQIP